MVSNVHEVLLPDLHKYRAIVVTGPQRSGTTFMGKAISYDTGRIYVDEGTFAWHDRDLWESIVAKSLNSIIQCPTMMKYVHDVPDDVVVVVMRRPIDDILSSQDRIGWDGNMIELKRYGKSKGIACKVKYEWWDEHKHKGPKNWVEVNYEDMSGHPLWVEKELRKDFDSKQTEVKGDE